MRASIAVAAAVFSLLAAGASAATLTEAKALFEDRRLPQARAAFEALARTGPARAEARFYLGRIASLENDRDSAAKHLEAAAALDPNSARYRFWLGRTYAEMAERDHVLKAMAMAQKAEAAFEKAVALDPAYLEARLALIDSYMTVRMFIGGDEKKAGAQVAAIERIDPAFAHRARARLHHRAGRGELVTREYRTAVRRFPNDPRTRLWLSIHLSEPATMDAAIREVDEALRVDPSYMPAYYHRGRLAVLSGRNLPKGEAALRKYLTWLPGDDDPSITMAHYQLGLLYEKLGRKDQALAELKEAERRAPRWHGTRHAIARVSRRR